MGMQATMHTSAIIGRVEHKRPPAPSPCSGSGNHHHGNLASTRRHAQYRHGRIAVQVKQQITNIVVPLGLRPMIAVTTPLGHSSTASPRMWGGVVELGGHLPCSMSRKAYFKGRRKAFLGSGYQQRRCRQHHPSLIVIQVPAVSAPHLF